MYWVGSKSVIVCLSRVKGGFGEWIGLKGSDRPKDIGKEEGEGCLKGANGGEEFGLC